MLGSAELASTRGQSPLGGPESWATSTAIGKQFASVVEKDDAVTQQAPSLPRLIRHDSCCLVIWYRPFRAPRPMLTHVPSLQAAVSTGPATTASSGSARARGDARRGSLPSSGFGCKSRARLGELSSHLLGDVAAGLSSRSLRGMHPKQLHPPSRPGQPWEAHGRGDYCPPYVARRPPPGVDLGLGHATKRHAPVR